MEQEQYKKENTEEKNKTAIALITQDIGYIKNDLNEIKGELKAVLGHYIHRDEFNKKLEDIQHQIDKRVEGLYERYQELDEKKLNIIDFEPVKTTLRNINYLVISTIIVGLLGLLIK